MSVDTPTGLQAAAAAALTEAARAVINARRTFPYVVDLAKTYGLDDPTIRQLCADAGLDWPDVRALLDQTVTT